MCRCLDAVDRRTPNRTNMASTDPIQAEAANPEEQPVEPMAFEPPTLSTPNVMRFLRNFTKWALFVLEAISYSLHPVVLVAIMFVNKHATMNSMILFSTLAPWTVAAVHECLVLLTNACGEHIDRNLEGAVDLSNILNWMLLESNIQGFSPLARRLLNFISAVASFGFCVCFGVLAWSLLDADDWTYQLIILTFYLLNQFLDHIGGRVFFRNVVTGVLVVCIMAMMLVGQNEYPQTPLLEKLPSVFGTTIITMGAVGVVHPVNLVRSRLSLAYYYLMTVVIMILVLVFQVTTSLTMGHLDYFVYLQPKHRNTVAMVLMIGISDHVCVSVQKMTNIVPNNRVFREISRAAIIYAVFMLSAYAPVVSMVIIKIGSLCAFDHIVILPIFFASLKMCNTDSMNAWLILKLSVLLGFAVFFCYCFLAFAVPIKITV